MYLDKEEYLEIFIEQDFNKIIFVWYTPMNGVAGSIKRQEKITLPTSTEKEQVYCQVADISGFSSHIDHDELVHDCLSNLNLARGADIVLTHGTESRIKLVPDIQKYVIGTRRNIQVLVPELWDTYECKWNKSQGKLIAG